MGLIGRFTARLFQEIQGLSLVFKRSYQYLLTTWSIFPGRQAVDGAMHKRSSVGNSVLVGLADHAAEKTSLADEIINCMVCDPALEVRDRLNSVTRGGFVLRLNIQAAWIAIMLGFIAGACSGLFFHKESWLGGYGSWRRRLLRLAHISFFGLAFINFAYVYSASFMNLPGTPLVSVLFVVALFTMPLVCYLSAWKEKSRNLFFIPVGSVTTAAALVLVELF